MFYVYIVLTSKQSLRIYLLVVDISGLRGLYVSLVNPHPRFTNENPFQERPSRLKTDPWSWRPDEVTFSDILENVEKLALEDNRIWRIDSLQKSLLKYHQNHFEYLPQASRDVKRQCTRWMTKMLISTETIALRVFLIVFKPMQRHQRWSFVSNCYWRNLGSLFTVFFLDRRIFCW